MEKLLLAIPNRCTGCNRCAYACSAVKEGMFIPSKARIKSTILPMKAIPCRVSVFSVPMRIA